MTSAKKKSLVSVMALLFSPWISGNLIGSIQFHYWQRFVLSADKNRLSQIVVAPIVGNKVRECVLPVIGLGIGVMGK